jgi:hypothetical protein
MSNAKELGPPYVPQADLGIGLCLACLGEVMVGERHHPEFGITFAPMLWPPGARDGVPVAVPACWQHVQDAAGRGQPRPSLLAATGKVPRR